MHVYVWRFDSVGCSCVGLGMVLVGEGAAGCRGARCGGGLNRARFVILLLLKKIFMFNSNHAHSTLRCGCEPALGSLVLGAEGGALGQVWWVPFVPHPARRRSQPCSKTDLRVTSEAANVQRKPAEPAGKRVALGQAQIVASLPATFRETLHAIVA